MSAPKEDKTPKASSTPTAITKPPPPTKRPKIPIPPEFASELHYTESLDPRTDAEILNSLNTKHLITSEKNVWAFWHSGITSMPTWCQHNVVNWSRFLGHSWTIRVLDRVPGSPNNALAWIPASLLPACFVNETMGGEHVGQHSADFCRGAALWLFGGVWMDVGIVLFRHLDAICWDLLEDERSEVSVAVPVMFERFLANGFVGARKGDRVVKKWHDLFVYLWEDRTSSKGISASPLLLDIIPRLRFDLAKERGWNMNMDEGVDVMALLDYLGQVLCWTRVSLLQEPNNGFNGVEYYSKKVLLFDAMSEGWGAEEIIGFSGEDLFRILTTKLDQDPASEEYKIAHKVVWTILSRSSFQKVYRGWKLTRDPALGVLLDRPENEGRDVEPGTFAEVLRYGSVFLEQTRKGISFVEAEMPDGDMVIRKGLLEP